MDNTVLKLLNLNFNRKSEEKDFKKVRALGFGAFGTVDLCTLQEDKFYARKGEKVAVKKMKKVPNRKMALKEARVLSKLDFPLIVRYLDSFRNARGKLCIVMEYCDFGTLEDYLTSYVTKPFPEFGIWRLIAQFCQALSFLHSQQPPILHNDLKPANILCKNETSEGVKGAITIKIADFGVSSVLGEGSYILVHDWIYILILVGETPAAMYYHANPHGCSICYVAPELLRGGDQHLTTSADMWSLGALISFMANDREHLFRTERDVLMWRGDKSPLRRDFKFPELHDLVLSLLRSNKELRPSAEEIVKDLFREENNERQIKPDD